MVYAQSEAKIFCANSDGKPKAYIQCRIPLSWVGSPFLWRIAKGDSVFAGDKYLIEKGITVYGRSSLPVNLEVVLPKSKPLKFHLNGPIDADSLAIGVPDFGLEDRISSVFPFSESRKTDAIGYWKLNEGLYIKPLESNFLPKDSLSLQAVTFFYLKGDSTEDFLVRMGISAYPLGASVGSWMVQKVVKGGKTVAFQNSFNIEKLPNGNYYLYAELFSALGKSIDRKYWAFQRHNPNVGLLKETTEIDVASDRKTNKMADFTLFINAKETRKALASLEPIVAESEYKAILLILSNKADSVRQKEYLWDFWKRRDPTSPTFGFETYRDKIVEAERQYSVFRRNVWKTDRGRVFLQYGKPYQTDNETTFRQRGITQGSVPFEVWNFRSTDKVGVSNAQFVFIADPSSPNDYRLVHSTAPGEPNNPNWQQLLLTGNRR